MNEYRERLEDIIRHGVAVDLFHADEALSLDMFVGQHANEINKATFGAFFGSLQIMLTRNLILHVARMYETPKMPNKRNPSPYPIRSIRSAIEILKEYGDDLAIEQRHGLISALARRGVPPDEMEELSDRELTNYLVSFFEQRYSAAHLDGAANARALEALKTMRDKVIAHPEAVRLEDIPRRYMRKSKSWSSWHTLLWRRLASAI
ncbi:MAG: hypothetical protein WAX67_01610 [Rugosibacter sp.]